MYGKINTYFKVPIRVVSPFTKYTTHPKYLNWVLNMCKSRSNLWFIRGCFIFGGWGYIPINYHWLVSIYILCVHIYIYIYVLFDGWLMGFLHDNSILFIFSLHKYLSLQYITMPLYSQEISAEYVVPIQPLDPSGTSGHLQMLPQLQMFCLLKQDLAGLWVSLGHKLRISSVYHSFNDNSCGSWIVQVNGGPFYHFLHKHHLFGWE
jgi:hypothetical protein